VNFSPYSSQDERSPTRFEHQLEISLGRRISHRAREKRHAATQRVKEK
jgi:hypothetical protein